MNSSWRKILKVAEDGPDISAMQKCSNGENCLQHLM